MGKKRHDWKAIEKDYVEGNANNDGTINYPTMRDLAARYSIDISTIGRRAKKDQWATKKEIYANKVTEVRQQRKAEIIGDEGRSFDLACFNLAEHLRSEIDEMLSRDGGIATPKNLSLLTASLKNLQAVGKAALGDDKESGNQELTIKVGIDNADT